MNTDNTRAPSSRPGRRWMIAGAFAAAIGAMAVTGASFADEAGGMHGMRGGHGHHAMDPAAMSKHIDKMVEKVLADGTPEQKEKVAAIAKAAMTDLMPLRQQTRDARARAHQLLSQPTIDRAALEQLRATQMQSFDQVSRRILQAVEDAADVLTPAQRVKFAEHLKHRGH